MKPRRLIRDALVSRDTSTGLRIVAATLVFAVSHGLTGIVLQVAARHDDATSNAHRAATVAPRVAVGEGRSGRSSGTTGLG